MCSCKLTPEILELPGFGGTALDELFNKCIAAGFPSVPIAAAAVTFVAACIVGNQMATQAGLFACLSEPKQLE
eukprot:CAMPEP_0172664786 /NCGR_PEP_ID=MMETSP1074-20121228/6832_1 /TAXON_ID=2916 /ORGANISM="Ceratium fusus, Strain PA161109" /LENGTH=72 /DNA_ID=CAMNT_0013481005 /DNA_START=497 /DNA_END=712 /DNA_ORIENTATION=-